MFRAEYHEANTLCSLDTETCIHLARHNSESILGRLRDLVATEIEPRQVWQRVESGTEGPHACFADLVAIEIEFRQFWQRTESGTQ